MKVIDERVRAYAEALRDDAEVSMDSIKPPVCGTPACHSGEAMLALNKLGVPDADWPMYHFLLEADRLAGFLLGLGPVPNDAYGTRSAILCEWARENPEIWDNPCGYEMFGSGAAFGFDTDHMPPGALKAHWLGVADRLESGMEQNEVYPGDC